jgi:hypothetical protein
MPPQNQTTPEGQIPSFASPEVKINSPEQTRPLTPEEIEALRQRVESERAPQAVQPQSKVPAEAVQPTQGVRTATGEEPKHEIDLRPPVLPDPVSALKTLENMSPFDMVVARNKMQDQLGYGIDTDDEVKAA